MSVLLAPLRLLGWPFRLYRRRISVQLITSHVLVVLLTAVVVELVAVLIIGIGIPILFTDSYTDYASVEVARTAATSLSTDDAASQLANGAAAVTADQRRELQQLADELAVSDSPSPGTIFLGGRIDGSAIADHAGVSVVTSSPNWLADDGQPTPVTELASRLIARIVELDGRPNAYGEPYVIDSVDTVTVIAYPIVRDDALAGVVVIRSTSTAPPTLFSILDRPDILFSLLIANAVIFVLILIPTLFVAVPIGIWRAHVVSRRIAGLATTTAAMAAGNRGARVSIDGQDEMAQLGRQFNAMLDHLDRADRERRAFVANVSHDLRTPIAIIQGHIEQLIDQPDAPSAGELRQTLDVIHQEAATLSHLIDDLFTIARLEETSLPMQLEPVNVGAIASEVAGAIRPVAWDQRKVQIESVMSPLLSPALADPVRVRQILNNLVYNALRHTPEGGLVVIDGEAAGPMVEIRVSDTGVGMTDEERQHVFERFYQVEQGRRAHDGAGLGLAIVKELVEAMGGVVGVDSVPGQGTTFRVRLPAARASATQPP